MRQYVTCPNCSSTSLNAMNTVASSGSGTSGTSAIPLALSLASTWRSSGLGQVHVDRVQQRLNGLVLVGRAHHHRADLLRDRGLANRLVNQLDRHVLLFEQQLHDLVRDHRERFEHPLAGSLRRFLQVLRHRHPMHVSPAVAVKQNGFPRDQVDHALEVRLAADLDLKRNRRQPQLALQLRDHVVRIRARCGPSC